jgi:hypothetical protein
MSKLRAFFGNEHIAVSIATGISIIALAYFSKRVLPEPLSYLELAAPPFLMAIFEAVASSEKNKNAWFRKAWLWAAAIVAATVLMIVVNAL